MPSLFSGCFYTFRRQEKSSMAVVQERHNFEWLFLCWCLLQEDKQRNTLSSAGGKRVLGMPRVSLHMMPKRQRAQYEKTKLIVYQPPTPNSWLLDWVPFHVLTPASISSRQVANGKPTDRRLDAQILEYVELPSTISRHQNCVPVVFSYNFSLHAHRALYT